MPKLESWAEQQPDKTAYYFPQTGERATYAQLDVRAHRAAHWFISLGLKGGDHIALLMENRPELFDIAWAARRAGLYYTVISTHLKPAEVAYILDNCEAKLLIASGRQGGLASAAIEQAGAPDIAHYSVADSDATAADYESAVAAFDDAGPLPARPVGRDLLYSSGTTGQPKGVTKPLVPAADRAEPEPDVVTMQRVFGFDASWVYLSPGPLYHAAPLRFCMMTLICGGTCIVLGRFDPRDALAAIETERVTHSQWVPTMFIRMLDLPGSERDAYDLSSMRAAIHAAAPCPAHIKERMIAWWGPIIQEYYAGSEGFGTTLIGTRDWLEHKGSVGRPLVGEVHILDDDGGELPAGQVGMIYFSGGPTFEYHNAPEKIQGVYREGGMATYGDLGHVDADGFLYLSDRRADLIISGGVNIYPKEIEDVLIRHASVADAAVIGIPDSEFGEQIKAVVQLHIGVEPSQTLGTELIDFCREHMSNVKSPKTVEFDAQLPRQENGKLPRRLLKARYRDTA